MRTCTVDLVKNDLAGCARSSLHVQIDLAHCARSFRARSSLHLQLLLVDLARGLDLILHRLVDCSYSARRTDQPDQPDGQTADQLTKEVVDHAPRVRRGCSVQCP